MDVSHSATGINCCDLGYQIFLVPLAFPGLENSANNKEKKERKKKKGKEERKKGRKEGGEGGNLNVIELHALSLLLRV